MCLHDRWAGAVEDLRILSDGIGLWKLASATQRSQRLVIERRREASAYARGFFAAPTKRCGLLLIGGDIGHAGQSNKQPCVDSSDRHLLFETIMREMAVNAVEMGSAH